MVAWFEAVAPAWRATLAAPVAAGAGDEMPSIDERGRRRTAGLDEVTGLPGRQAFFDECARVLTARIEDRRPTVLVLVQLLPAAGLGAIDERVMAAAGEALSRNTRGGDFVGRYAERELVALLPDTNAEEGAATLARLREVLGDVLARTAGSGNACTSELALSVAPECGTTAGALLAAADASLRRVRNVSRPVHALRTAA